jgi:hypothetical protein
MPRQHSVDRICREIEFGEFDAEMERIQDFQHQETAYGITNIEILDKVLRRKEVIPCRDTGKYLLTFGVKTAIYKKIRRCEFAEERRLALKRFVEFEGEAQMAQVEFDMQQDLNDASILQNKKEDISDQLNMYGQNLGEMLNNAIEPPEDFGWEYHRLRCEDFKLDRELADLCRRAQILMEMSIDLSRRFRKALSKYQRSRI